MNPENPSIPTCQCDVYGCDDCFNCILKFSMFESKVNKLKQSFRENKRHVDIQEEKIRVAERIKERFESAIKANCQDLQVIKDKIDSLAVTYDYKKDIYPAFFNDTTIKDKIMKVKFE